MTEKLLQFIWQYQYFNKSQLQSTEGENIILVSTGLLNNNQGPDFLNARIKVGNTFLAGSIELHLKTSDWHKHHHEHDPNYKNVILHVVYNHDLEKHEFPVLELQSRISKIIIEKYYFIMSKEAFVPCESSLTKVKEIIWSKWKERLLVERLTRKSKKVYEFLNLNSFNWEESFWWILARNFGSTVNADAFEKIAQSIPHTIIVKHRNSVHQIEALLFGQANLLAGKWHDQYAVMLFKEYAFLSRKYTLQSIHIPLHFLRMRPSNFPSIRLAQLAMLLHQSNHLLQRILEEDTIDEIRDCIAITANDYWHYRYRFDELSNYKPKKIGEDMVNNIFINSIIPILFTYGDYHNQESYKIKALTWLEQIRAEKNSFTNGFVKLQVSNLNAFDSQALIELKQQYCDLKRCLECSVGNTLFKPD